jgi:hypothetical protein
MAVCKVQVGILWRCGDSLFFEVPSDAFLTMLHTHTHTHTHIENGVVTVVLKEPFLGCQSNLSGASALRDLKVAMDALTEVGGTPLEHPLYSPDLTPI